MIKIDKKSINLRCPRRPGPKNKNVGRNLSFCRVFNRCGSVREARVKGNKKNDRTVINWDETSTAAFDKCKQSLATATLLVHPTQGAKISLYVDASDIAMGAALQQETEKVIQPLSFYSRKFTDTRKKYSTYESELLAIYTAVKHFKHMLEAVPFVVYTDHKPLTCAFCQKSEKASPRQVRHLDFIGQYSTDIRHVSGKDNVVADTLSRIEVISQAIDFDHLADSQRDNQDLLQCLQLKTLALKKV